MCEELLRSDGVTQRKTLVHAVVRSKLAGEAIAALEALPFE